LALALAVTVANLRSPTSAVNMRTALDELLRSREGRGKLYESRYQSCDEFTLTPTKGEAAALRVIVPHSPGEVVTIWAGRGTVFEVPEGGRRYTTSAQLGEILTICGAVMDQGLEESVVFDGGELLRGVGTVRLPGASSPTKVQWGRLSLRPFSKKEQSSTNYEPW